MLFWLFIQLILGALNHLIFHSITGRLHCLFLVKLATALSAPEKSHIEADREQSSIRVAALQLLWLPAWSLESVSYPLNAPFPFVNKIL